jgi:hypothetical protein
MKNGRRWVALGKVLSSFVVARSLSFNKTLYSDYIHSARDEQRKIRLRRNTNYKFSLQYDVCR